MELPVPDIDANDMPGAGLQQVRPAMSTALDDSAPASFWPPRETKRSSASAVTVNGVSGANSSAALATMPPGQLTRPAAIMRWAAVREAASPDATSN